MIQLRNGRHTRASRDVIRAGAAVDEFSGLAPVFGRTARREDTENRNSHGANRQMTTITQAEPRPAAPAPRPPRYTGRLARLGDIAYRRRGRMLIAWIVALAAIAALSAAIAGDYNADYGTPGSESEQASQVFEQNFPGTSGDTIDVVWQDASGANSPQVRAEMRQFFRQAQSAEGVGRPTAPRIAPEGTIATASLNLTERAWDVPISTGEKLIDLAEKTSGDGLRVELRGGPIQDAEGGGSPEGVGFFAAAIVLLIAFGSVVAAGLPLAVALFGLGISASLIGVLALLIDVPDWAPAVAG